MTTDTCCVRLFCVPHAGGSSYVYEPWRSLLPPGLELAPIELPGRGRRLRDAPVANLQELVDDVTVSILTRLKGPFALFGHSFGALLAFECARVLTLAHDRPPQVVFASGHRAPQLTARGNVRLADLDTASFLMKVHAMDSELNGALSNPELCELWLPAIRNDMRIAEGYRYRAGAPLTSALVALGGVDDPHVTREELQAWAKQTSSTFHLRLFCGNHFFLHHLRGDVIAEVVRCLQRYASSQGVLK